MKSQRFWQITYVQTVLTLLQHILIRFYVSVTGTDYLYSFTVFSLAIGPGSMIWTYRPTSLHSMPFHSHICAFFLNIVNNCSPSSTPLFLPFFYLSTIFLIWQFCVNICPKQLLSFLHYILMFFLSSQHLFFAISVHLVLYILLQVIFHSFPDNLILHPVVPSFCSIECHTPDTLLSE